MLRVRISCCGLGGRRRRGRRGGKLRYISRRSRELIAGGLGLLTSCSVDGCGIQLVNNIQLPRRLFRLPTLGIRRLPLLPLSPPPLLSPLLLINRLAVHQRGIGVAAQTALWRLDLRAVVGEDVKFFGFAAAGAVDWCALALTVGLLLGAGGTVLNWLAGRCQVLFADMVSYGAVWRRWT